jgi:hypothetical protein
VKGALKQALIPTLQEAGYEGMFETSREGDPHKLVFFEIFSPSTAHKFDLEQDYARRLFTALESMSAGAPIMTKLNALSNVGTSMVGQHTFASERKNRKLFRTKGVFLCGSCNS